MDYELTETQRDVAELAYQLGQQKVRPMREHYDAINALMAGDDLIDIANRLRELQSDDAWLQSAAKTFAKGAPSSATLSFELWQRVHRMSLAEVFRLEYWASLGFCAHEDFAEVTESLCATCSAISFTGTLRTRVTASAESRAFIRVRFPHTS